MEEKVQVVFEFDRSEFDAYVLMAGVRNSVEEEVIWNGLLKGQVVANPDLLEEQRLSVTFLMIGLAIASFGEKYKG